MLFPDPPSPRTNVTPRTELGAEGARFPPGTNPEIHIALPACRTCTKKTTHGTPCSMVGARPTYGLTRTAGITQTQLITVPHLNKTYSMAWLLGYVMDGMPYANYLYNLGLGTANNLTQQTTYQIRAVGTRTLTLYGPNPRRIYSPRSVVNASWPLPAEADQRPPYITDEAWEAMRYGRILSGGDYHTLPVGALLRFQSPSVLADVNLPYITRIDYPETDAAECEFVVHISRNATNATQPYDRAHPAPVYLLTAYYYYVVPDTYFDHQPQPEQQFAPNRATILAADLISNDGIANLPRTDAVSSRVLHTTITVQYKNTVTLAPYTDPLDIEATWDGTRYTTLLDLSALIAATPDLEYVILEWWAEAAPADTIIVPTVKTCANDKQFPWETSRRCTDTRCAKFQDGDYLPGNCWQTPTADRFTIDTPRSTTTDGTNNTIIASLWNRLPVYLEQGNAGDSSHRNFAFGRPTTCGAGLASIIGGYFDQVPTGIFPLRVPFMLPSLGQLRLYDDATGRHAALVHGLYEARHPDFDGALTQYISGYASRHDARNQTLDAVAGLYPQNHPPARNLYTMQLLTDGTNNTPRLSSTSHRCYLTGASPTAVDATTLAEVKTMLGI